MPQRPRPVSSAIRQRAVQAQLAEDVDRLLELLVARHREEHRGERLGAPHEPVAHARHDPVVGLDEQRVEHGTEAALVEVPRLVVGHRAHAGADDLAVGQDDLHPAR
jgi:hypothetical protein